jgi:hypothetical protein
LAGRAQRNEYIIDASLLLIKNRLRRLRDARHTHVIETRLRWDMLPLDHAHPSSHSTDAQALAASERLAVRLLIGFGVIVGMMTVLWAIAQLVI